MTPEEIVRAFIAAVTGGDQARAAEFVADDIVYENIGFGPTSFEAQWPTINGAKAAFAFLAPIEDAEWVIHRDLPWGMWSLTSGSTASRSTACGSNTRRGDLRGRRREDHLLA
jgi:hypothetical protein